MGKPDVGLVQMKDILDLSWNIVQAVAIPVMADIDTGGGNAVNAAWVTERLIAMGLAGMNIEDQVFPKRCGHMAGQGSDRAEEMAGKIRRLRRGSGPVGPRFRHQRPHRCLLEMGLEEAVRRANLYFEAGADMSFIDGIRTKQDIERAVRAIRRAALGQPDGRDLGDEDGIDPRSRTGQNGGRSRFRSGRIGDGRPQGADEFFYGAQTSPDGILAGQTQWVASFEEFTDFVGLKEYRAMEDEYLPRERIRSKYKDTKKIVG